MSTQTRNLGGTKVSTRFYGDTRLGKVNYSWVRNLGTVTDYGLTLYDATIDQSKVDSIDRLLRDKIRDAGLEGSIEIEQYSEPDYYSLVLRGKSVDEDKPEGRLEGDRINSAIVQIARAIEREFFPQQQRTGLWDTGTAVAAMVRSD